MARLVPVPAVSPTVWLPVVTDCTPVVPPSPTFEALAAPSTRRLNLPVSPAGATTFLVTLIVPVSRVLVTSHLTHSPQLRLNVIFRVAGSNVVSVSTGEVEMGSPWK